METMTRDQLVENLIDILTGHGKANGDVHGTGIEEVADFIEKLVEAEVEDAVYERTAEAMGTSIPEVGFQKW